MRTLFLSLLLILSALPACADAYCCCLHGGSCSCERRGVECECQARRDAADARDGQIRDGLILCGIAAGFGVGGLVGWKWLRPLPLLLACLAPLPACASDLTLTHLGTVRLPSVGRNQWNNPVYFKGPQVVAACETDHTKLWLTWNRAVGQIQLPAEILNGDVRNSKFATWVKPPVTVGNEFRDLVVAAGQTSAWARLHGVCESQGRVWLNYGMYYHVIPNTFPNLNSVSTNLTDETPLLIVPNATHVKNTGGWLAKVPRCWIAGTNVLARGSTWTWGNDGGPRSSLIDVADPALPWTFATSYKIVTKLVANTNVIDYDKSITVDPSWSMHDTWTSCLFFETPSEKPFTHGERFVGFIVRKGTAPGWYGEANAGTNKNPCSGAKGYHAYPYTAELWLFKWAEILHVIDGTASTTYPKPCQKIVMPEFGGCAYIGTAAQAGNLIYVIHENAHKPSFAPTEVEYVNCLRVYEVGF